MIRLDVYYHGFCYDGVTSAAIFTRFFRERIDGGALVRHVGMTHGQGDPYGDDHDAFFGGAEINAVLDFRFSPSARLHWFCDHHQSTLIDPSHGAQLQQALRGSRQVRYDPHAPSCAGLLRRWLVEEHGLDARMFDEHARWADLIDSAAFVDARQAVELAEPALQLAALLESAPAPEVVGAVIDGLAAGTIEQTRALPAVEAAVGPVLARQRQALDEVRRRLQVDRRVGFFDLADRERPSVSKFIAYYLDDGLDYVVSVTRSAARVKISVGSNPWRRPEPLQNLAELCGRYGGGGHAVVAGVSLPPAELERARAAAREVVGILRGGTR